jgi:hypothetical protein
MLKMRWRKRVGVEPTGDGIARRPPVLKTGTITGPHALPCGAQGVQDPSVCEVLVPGPFQPS